MSAPLKRRILPASKQQNVVKPSVKEQKIDRTILLFSADSVRRGNTLKYGQNRLLVRISLCIIFSDTISQREGTVS